MVPVADLVTIARARLDDAESLLAAARFDAALYICGYAIEVALKVRICRTLGWPGYPSTSKEFDRYHSFRTHDLVTLLHLSGIEKEVTTTHFALWSVVIEWGPEVRYDPVGTTSRQAATDIVDAARALLGIL